MLQRQFVLQPNSDYLLHVTAKQYWLPEFEAHWGDIDAQTLILLHSTSFHKEIWEPTIQSMFEVLVSCPSAFKNGDTGNNPLKIKCAWAIECPNHGQSAVLNDTALQQFPYFRNFGCEKYAEAVHHFMTSASTLSPPVNFSTQKLVGIGHSLGGVAIAILQILQPVFPFEALVLVEPLLSPQGLKPLHPLQRRLIQSAYDRRDVWPSRANALQYFTARRKITHWDLRVLELYVKFGLKPHQEIPHESTLYEVGLACSREEEATMYRDPTGPSSGLEALNEVSGRIPVSVIFGGEKDLIPHSVQDALVDCTSRRHFLSVHRIEGAGHLIPQQVPEELGRVIVDILIGSRTHLTSKL
ncbi:hypothetical protein SCLCIDRAFT_141294 [Scleroderma citrinum Foug A]|uniref:AB hydrolase-1 domain-containing protein n=1 Tax=Scleroderma citrinum Foug A TaxID=1036808 RepID=A0A0C3CUX4_9AGAM|nr:hypothetical protein SCLCIDRAFT_141294 [Scleroderma citrinum Foug A]